MSGARLLDRLVLHQLLEPVLEALRIIVRLLLASGSRDFRLSIRQRRSGCVSYLSATRVR